MLHAFYSVLSRLSHSVLIMLKSGLWWGQSITHNVPLFIFLSRYMYTALAECWWSSDQMWVSCISCGITFINLLQPPTHDCRCSLFVLYFFSDSLYTYWHIFFIILIWIVTPEELLPLILGLFFMWFGIPQSFLFVSLLFFPQILTSHIASVIYC